MDRGIAAVLPAVPRLVVRRIGRRYVAGEGLEDGLRVVRRLLAEGASATVDVVGEQVLRREDADGAVEEYLRLLEALRAQASGATISLKPSLVGLGIGEDVALEGLDRVFAAAARSSILVQIDMEGASSTDSTLRLYRAMLERHGNAGAVLQASLKRTLDDIDRLPPGAVVRLCKGIYVESGRIQHHGRRRVRRAYVEALEKLLARPAYVGIATHDDVLVEKARELVAGLAPDRYEFQMLLGVRPGLRRSLIGRGHRVRVYVPYGRDWQAYSMRRLRENPAIARHVLGALLDRG